MSTVGLSINAKKVVHRGLKAYRILGFSCYDEQDLPLAYFDEKPYCVRYKGQMIILTNDKSPVFEGGGCAIEVNDIIPEDDFRKVAEVLKYCGKKLHDINESIKLLKQDWRGEGREITI